MIVINGKFYSQELTGVQRYAREIVLEIDKQIKKEDEFEIIIPPDAKDVPEFENIRVKKYGKLKGILWEQLCLPLYVLKNPGSICLNLGNVAPILTPHVVLLHDVSYKVNPKYFSKKFALWNKFIIGSVIHRAKKIVTISKFCKGEISRIYKLDIDKIDVVYSAWQHFENICEDRNAINLYGLKKEEYFFSMCSTAVHKNTNWIIEEARNYPNETFVLTGNLNKKIFAHDNPSGMWPSNVRIIGYVTDEIGKALMKDCKAFLFPSLYEGFGLPPLEALSVGAKIVISDIPSLREIYGNTAYYVDPHNANYDLDRLIQKDVMPKEDALNKYSWEYSASKFIELLKKL